MGGGGEGRVGKGIGGLKKKIIIKKYREKFRGRNGGNRKKRKAGWKKGEKRKTGNK